MTGLRANLAVIGAPRSTRPLVLVCTFMLCAGIVIGHYPVLALLPTAGVVVVFLLGSAAARAAFTVFGGLAVFQSSGELTALKLSYLVGAAMAAGVASERLWSIGSTGAGRSYRLLVWSAVAFAAYVALLVGLSVADGNPAVAAVRDAAPYLLFAFMPILALDLATSVSARVIRAFFLVAGLTGAAGFMVAWFVRRGLGDLPLERIALPSFMLPAALFCYACASALFRRRRRVVWVAVGALVFALVLGTATRSSLLYLVGPLAMVFAARKRLDLRRRGGFIAYAVVGAAGMALLLSYGAAVFVGAQRTRERLGSIATLLADPVQDPSFVERLVQGSVAWRLFVESPVTGAGLGHTFQWVTLSGEVRTGFNVDSPLSIPAKFGLLGVILLGLVGWFLVSEARSRLQAVGSIEAIALCGYLALAAAWLLLASPFEDKGFSFGLMFLLALGFSARFKGTTMSVGDASPPPQVTAR